VSKNRLSINQISIACRHVDELTAAGVSENLAIRTLELFADVYAKLYHGGSATPHHARQVPRNQWSLAARKLAGDAHPSWPSGALRVEHGTPRRHFARLVKQLQEAGRLTGAEMDLLCERYWKLAVITLEEDARLNKIARSKLFDTPEERWAAAGIVFPADGPSVEGEPGVRLGR
jgi:hypothetical protein